MERADFLDARNFFGKADAAGAMDAAGHDRLDQRPHFLVVHRALVFLEAGAVVAVGHRLVLQVAFAALVADRAVERMVDQQEFHHAPAGLDRLFRIRKDDHAVQDRLGAGGDRLGRPLHLHQAHAAVAGNRQPLVEAEMRHFLADRLQCLEQGQAAVDLMHLAVNGDRCHRVTPPPCVAGSGVPVRAGNAGSGPGSARPPRRPARRSCALRPGRSLPPACRFHRCPHRRAPAGS